MRILILTLLALAAAAPLAALPSAAPTTPSKGKVFLTIEEALELAFPDCEVTHTTVFLTDAQRARARKLAKVDVPSGIVRRYVATREGELVGSAYFDAHKVRTLKETVMVVVDPTDRIRRFELLAFGEPEEYIPRGNWYGQLLGRRLDDELNLGRGIRGVTGATLTARASTRAARRVLALHLVVTAAPSGEPAGSWGPRPGP